MRVMVLIKANDKSEAGVLPSEQLLTDMMHFNEELVKAGVMLGGDGLKASSEGARVQFSATEAPTVTDGPFAETKELVAGYWIWQVKSLDEAIEWAKRIPNTDGEHGTVELRPVGEIEDFLENLTDETRAKADALAAKLEQS